jgi:hypothetical protein
MVQYHNRDSCVYTTIWHGQLDIKTITFSGLVTQNEIVFQRVLFKVNEIVNCAREIRN